MRTNSMRRLVVPDLQRDRRSMHPLNRVRLHTLQLLRLNPDRVTQRAPRQVARRDVLPLQDLFDHSLHFPVTVFFNRSHDVMHLMK
jgi:hypothetical protein